VSFSIWALFVLTESVLCLTPGPAVLLVIAHALRRGAAAAAWATLGILSAIGGAGRGRAFVSGFVLQAANPKALVFFVALLPQFIDPAAHVTAQIIVLGVTSVAIELIVLLAYGACAGRVRALTARPRVARFADGVAGAMLVGAGIGLGATRA